MLRIVIRGAVLASVAAVVAAAGGAIGIAELWPLLLAAAVGLAATGPATGRLAAFVSGALVGWLLAALEAAVLPDVTATAALLAVVAVLLAALIGAASRGMLPLWAALVGFAAFSGLYGPTYAASPTTFLADSPVALVSLLLATAVGFATAIAADALTDAAQTERDPLIAADGEVA